MLSVISAVTLLASMYGDNYRDSVLADHLQSSLMLRYNGRSVNIVYCVIIIYHNQYCYNYSDYNLKKYLKKLEKMGGLPKTQTKIRE